jgi:hypothetical protein
MRINIRLIGLIHFIRARTAIIELLRDAWLEIQQSNPGRAKQIAQNWFEQPYPTFKRLALFAATQDKNIAGEEWLNWLREDDCWWLWTNDTHREAMRLLVLRGQDPTPIDQKNLETAILDGLPQKMFGKNLEPKDWQNAQDYSIWLRLAKLKSSGCLLGRDANKKLDDLSVAYPNWQLATNESDEFLIWMSGNGDSGFEDQNPIIRVPRQLDKLVIWLKQKHKTDPFNRNDWRDICQQKFATVVRAFCILSEENFWPSDFWQVALQTWSDEKRVNHCWRFVAPIVVKMPDEVLLDLAHTATWWLEAASKRLNFHEEALFFDLCHRYLAMDHPNSVSDNQTFSQAINHPVGHITQALFNILFYRQLNDNDCLPDDIKLIFTRLCGTEKKSYRHGRVILATKLISLFRVDQEWTEHYLFPIMSWQRSESEAKAAWTGFLWSPRIYWPLLTAIKDDFLKTAKYYDDLGYAGQQYAAILTYAALDPNNIFERKEFRSAIESLPKRGLQFIVRALTNALKSAGEQKEAYWQNCIKPFWQEVWPKSKDNISGPIAEQLARLCIAAGDEFPEALDTFFDWLQPLENPYHILYPLEESKLCSKFPKESLKLMDRIIENPLWSQPKLDKCLDDIITAWPEGQQDPRYQRLKNMK